MVLPTLIIPLLGFIFTLKFFSTKGVFGMIKLLSEGVGIFYPEAWVSLMPRYKILLFYGNLAFVLAIIGLLIAIKKYRVFMIWAVITGIWFYLNMLVFDQNILIPYLRLIWYFLFAIIPLSAIGLAWCINWVEEKIRFGRPLTTIISAALLLTVFITTFYTYYNIPYHLDLYRYIEPEDIEALKYAKDDVLTAVPLVKLAYDFFDFDFEIKSATELGVYFEKYNCTGKEKLMLENKVFYVLTNKKQNCSFLQPRYAGSIRYLYEATSGR